MSTFLIVIRHNRLIAPFLAGLFLSANLLANEQVIDVTDGWVRETPPGVRNAAAFLTLNNHSNTARQLIDVQCQTALAAHCEVHEHLHSTNGMRMQKVSAPLTIPAAGNLRFAPGGYHIMLLELGKPLLSGATVELIFIFDDQSSYKAQLPVKPVSQE
ncbi:MAG TPA: copper chaperone PCu(A)C [Pseudomonadales bacterium]|nr:copper chaperone PCu(A)C [Pseudomonadales bacterium]